MILEQKKSDFEIYEPTACLQHEDVIYVDCVLIALADYSSIYLLFSWRQL